MKRVVLAAALIGLAGVAQAQDASTDRLAKACSILPCVYDSAGKRIGLAGTPAQLGNVLVPARGTWYDLHFTEDGGFIENAELFYARANCTGQVYLADVTEPMAPDTALPLVAEWDGSVLWGGLGPLVTVPIAALLQGGSCHNTSFSLAGHVAVKLLSGVIFSPPFSVR